MNPPLSRRHFIAAASALAASTSARAAQPTFAPDFLWGAATAGHQAEGQNTNSDTWFLEHVRPTIFAESSGDACNSFHLWPEDMDIVRSLGLNTYRFSLEWARIEPAEGEFSIAMLDHYRRMIAGCRERGITPMVTFNHFTSPRWFAAKGGWEAPTAPAQFARYCERAARALAENIGYATTLNEPNILRVLQWLPLPFPKSMMETQQAMLREAARQCGVAKFSAANVGDADAIWAPMLAGHAAGYQAIKNVRPSLPVGVSISMTDDQAVGDPARRDAKRRLVYEPWLQEAAQHADFLGVQNYGRSRIDANGVLPPPPDAVLNQQHEEFYPASLEGAVIYAHQVSGKPIIVTENGIATADDTMRVRYIPLVMQGLGRAIAAGVPVLGYVHWSLLDNFEWIFGYGPKLGLCSVDHTTFKRTPKPSAYVYRDIVKRNGAA